MFEPNNFNLLSKLSVIKLSLNNLNDRICWVGSKVENYVSYYNWLISYNLPDEIFMIGFYPKLETVMFVILGFN